MIKGVNKVIIEVNDTGNEYFEKAILYVRPSKATKSHNLLENKAKEYLNEVNTVSNHEFLENKDYFIKRKRLSFILLGYFAVLAVVLYLIFS